MNPVITQMPAVEVVVPNELTKAEMETIMGSIVKTLQLYLHNSDLTLTLRVAEKQAMGRMLTRSEQLEEMSRQNKAVEMMLRHIAKPQQADRIAAAVEKANADGPKITGRPGGATAEEYTDYLLSMI